MAAITAAAPTACCGIVYTTHRRIPLGDRKVCILLLVVPALVKNWDYSHVSAELLIKKHTPPPFVFPVIVLEQSLRCTKKNPSCIDLSGVLGPSQVSVKQNTQQFFISLWERIRHWTSSSLLSRDWMLASSMLGIGGWVGRHCSLTGTPPRLPRLSGQLIWTNFLQTKRQDYRIIRIILSEGL